MNTKEKLMQLLELCIDKGLSYHLLQNNCITVFFWNGKETTFKERANLYYYDTNIQDKVIHENLNELIIKVKNYQS